MSTHRNNNKMAKKTIQIFLTVIVIFLLLNAIRQKKSPQSILPDSSQRSEVKTIENPILRHLQRPSDVTLRDGIAIGVALDVSGSMYNFVADQTGGTKAKIVIAQQCVLNLLEEVNSFVQKHPQQKIEVGIYEFSSRQGQSSCREVVPFGPVRLDLSRQEIMRMRAKGGTPIGDAIITVKQNMNRTGLKQQHLLVITDGENNEGYDPGDVVNAIYRLPEEQIASVYFFAFDIVAEKFNRVRDAGGLVLAASNEEGLRQTLDYVLAGKILVEQPEIPGAQ